MAAGVLAPLPPSFSFLGVLLSPFSPVGFAGVVPFPCPFGAFLGVFCSFCFFGVEFS